MLTFAVVAALAGWAAAFFMFTRSAGVQNDAPAQLSSSPDAEAKLDGLRKELAAAKDATERKGKQLEELKAEAKKKARREGKKEKATEPAEAQSAAEPSDKEARGEISRLKKAIVGLEKQIEITQREAATTVKDAEKIASEQIGGKLEAEKKKASEAIDARKKVERTLDELRASIKKKAESRPDVPGSGLDLKSLPTEVVQELARYFRKGEHFEKLHGVTQGQLQLAQDRFNEQQKRYFAVCRELAVVAGKAPGSDIEARDIAETATQKTNTAIKTAAAPRPSTPPAAAAADADGEDGEKKKRRRRRRKKKTDGAEASGESDGDESNGVEASSADGTNGAGTDASSNAPSSDAKSSDASNASSDASSDASGDASSNDDVATASASEEAAPKGEATPEVVAADTASATEDKPAPSAET